MVTKANKKVADELIDHGHYEKLLDNCISYRTSPPECEGMLTMAGISPDWDWSTIPVMIEKCTGQPLKLMDGLSYPFDDLLLQHASEAASGKLSEVAQEVIPLRPDGVSYDDTYTSLSIDEAIDRGEHSLALPHATHGSTFLSSSQAFGSLEGGDYSGRELVSVEDDEDNDSLLDLTKKRSPSKLLKTSRLSLPLHHMGMLELSPLTIRGRGRLRLRLPLPHCCFSLLPLARLLQHLSLLPSFLVLLPVAAFLSLLTVLWRKVISSVGEKLFLRCRLVSSYGLSFSCPYACH